MSIVSFAGCNSWEHGMAVISIWRQRECWEGGKMPQHWMLNMVNCFLGHITGAQFSSNKIEWKKHFLASEARLPCWLRLVHRFACVNNLGNVASISIWRPLAVLLFLGEKRWQSEREADERLEEVVLRSRECLGVKLKGNFFGNGLFNDNRYENEREWKSWKKFPLKWSSCALLRRLQATTAFQTIKNNLIVPFSPSNPSPLARIATQLVLSCHRVKLN